MHRICVAIWVLLLSACATNPPGKPAAVRIIRDNFGVPHVYASDMYGLYFGYGYAVAQDRLFQMEMTRRSTQGMVSEVLGADYLDYDKTTRRRFDPASIRRQLAALEDADRDIFAGFAAGMNAWLRKIRATPGTLLPKQFSDNGFQPADWTAYDVAMIFVGTMVNRYGDFNTELDNQAILQALSKQHGETLARQLFDLLNPRYTDNAPTTIPAADWSRPQPDNLARPVTEISGPLPALAGQPVLSAAVTSGMSNCFVLGRDKVEGASSILVNGPQFGWFNPAYVYSIGLHGAGIDVVGNTPFAYPVVMFGHNRSIAWGSTWAAGDIVDIYAEQLDPDDPSRYLYRGQYRSFERRVEVIRVRDAPSVSVDVFRSVHGPVFQTNAAAGVAYARQRAWDGRELATLLAWIRATRAGDYATWLVEAAKSDINVNMYYADVNGNIGYFFGGGYPQRAAGHDNRFPVSGDGSMDWLGRLPVDLANPHVENPSSGYLANWNNKPANGVMNPDFFFFSWSGADRVEILQSVLDEQPRFTPDDAWGLVRSSSYADVYAQYLMPLLAGAPEVQSDTRLKAANDILQTWNRASLDADGDGFYDGAATAIFRQFVAVLLEQVLADDLGDAYAPFATTGYPAATKPSAAGTNIQTGMKAVIESLLGRGGYDLLNGETAASVVARALSTALDSLAAEQGDDLTAYRLAVASRPFSNINFLGIPQAGEDELLTAPIEQNRGTENDMIVLRQGAIEGWEVTPPGQNAFISPAGEKGAHYDDQFDLYGRFGKKRMWFYRQDVDANQVSEAFINYVR